MKVFHINSKSLPKQKSNSESIINIISNLGHKVETTLIDEAEIKTSFNFEKNFQKNINAIKKCDFVVAEISNMTSGMFFIIASALNEKRPVLALINNKRTSLSDNNLSNFSQKNKLFFYKEYTDKTLEQEIAKFITDVKKIIDTKFILIISSQIDQYLEWASVNRRMHKAQVVRRAVEVVMNEDKEYKKFSNQSKRKKKI